MKKIFFTFIILIMFVICGPAKTKVRSSLQTDLTGNWFFISPSMSGKVSVLKIYQHRGKNFNLRILGSASVIDSDWEGVIRNGDVSFSGLFYDGGGPRARVRFSGRLISASFIKGNIKMENVNSNKPTPTVKVFMFRTAQSFTEKYWGFVNRSGHKLIAGIVEDSSGNFISGGFSGWPYGEESSCLFLQCGGQIYDYIKEGRKIILKADAIRKGEGVAVLCFTPGTPGTGYYTVSGCSASPLKDSFKAYGPFYKAEQIPFISLKKVNIKKVKKIKTFKKK
jgi:hypothetical protein